LTHESPVPPSRRDDDVKPPADRPEQSGAGHPNRVRESIRKLAQARLRQDISVPELRDVLSQLKEKLAEICADERKARLERLKLRKRRDLIHAAVVKLRQLRLKKSSRIVTESSKIKIILSESEEPLTEVEALERKKNDIEADLEGFRETLRMHRRDRDAAFRELAAAQSVLQDKLTERMLWKILEAQSDESRDEEHRGIEGLTAELLGRLLVLEKEESQLGGLIAGDRGEAGEK
jgi:hypothetical protein